VLARKSCPVCQGTPIEVRHGWLFQCNGCELLSSTLDPEIPTVVGHSQIDEAARANGLAVTRQRNNAVILDQLEQLLGGAKHRLLDVGCGQGQFLLDATKRGFTVIGIEPDANVAPKTAAMTQCAVRPGFFPEVVAADERFDAIIFNDVFEHIPDATGAIQACHAHLEPGGILVLNCPDRRGVFYRYGNFLDKLGISAPFHRLWQKGLPSPHVWYFTPSDLIRLGQTVGLRERATVALLPIAFKGLADRIFHVEGQSKLLGMAAYIAALLSLPLLRVLPHDIGVVFLSKSDDRSAKE
jgi:SAM-dependent methyltransferase